MENNAKQRQSVASETRACTMDGVKISVLVSTALVLMTTQVSVVNTNTTPVKLEPVKTEHPALTMAKVLPASAHLVTQARLAKRTLSTVKKTVVHHQLLASI